MRKFEACRNPHCNTEHSWTEEASAEIEKALCASCRAQLTFIRIHSETTYLKLREFLCAEL